ncbi:CHRD domain-containing protein [Pelotalea chapellei]|uniref:CHRD domain-containing protein n=1 Tax=Pelotalea chapellei TaxID=44671 RepID=A0ABS5UBY3_9BACT|nr:CHRD domain-containing protein [Pelotalea chapellei]MBT1073204.1 CHRD domain-containing protein [Pelotalea chapellei]
MRNLRISLASCAALLALSTTAPLHAALSSVAGIQSGTPPVLSEVTAAGNPANVAVSLATGFPLWYKDSNNLKLELCLDQTVVKQGGGTFIPCLTAEPFNGSPISFPNNFGPEAFYWAAVAVNPNLVSTVNGTPVAWNALLVMGQEAAFVNGISAEGNQAVFSRIRVRINVPVPGTYRVTHPFGTRDYVVAAGVTGVRDINQTQDLGLEITDTFLTSLSDAPLPPPFPQPTPPSLPFGLHGGIIDQDGKSIGPFLTPRTPLVTAANGAVYLADTGTVLAHNEVPINPGPFGDFFRIELVGDATGTIGSIPAGVILNPADNNQRVEINTFQVSGKLFNDGLNTAPIAHQVSVSTAMNTPVTIDVSQSVSDPISATNVHGINPQAIGIFVTPSDIRRSSSFITGKGATVRRFINTSTGKATLTYTPATGDTGLDSFQYVVQDTGGLISAPATVSVTVENLAVTSAVYRPKFNKWRIEGNSSSTASNLIVLASDPIAILSGANESPAVTTQASGTTSLAVGKESIDFTLNLAKLPSTKVTAVHVHYGAPGASGPVLFSLYDDLDGPFATPSTGRLTFGNLQQRADIGILTFTDAINAIMAGTTYVNVHTAANPSGEIRGQLVARPLGNAVVSSDGSWNYKRRSTINPLGVRGINAISSNGVRLLGIPLSIR